MLLVKRNLKITHILNFLSPVFHIAGAKLSEPAPSYEILTKIYFVVYKASKKSDDGDGLWKW